MESHDPFATATAGVESEDPFADSGVDPEDFGTDPASELEGPPPPVVNREGERVPETHMTAGASRPPEAEVAPSEAESPAEATQDPETPPAQPQAPAAAQNGAGEATGQADAAPKAKGKGKGKKAKAAEGHRLYRPLYQTGPEQWTEVKLTGEAVKDIRDHLHERGGKVWIQANNIDQARRLGYVAAGRPRDGVRIVLVAEKGWQPKTVKPRPVVPREALEIS